MPPEPRNASARFAKEGPGSSICPPPPSGSSIRIRSRGMPNLLHPDETEEEEAVPETPNDPGDFVLADTADDELLAGLLVRACEEAGIQVIRQDPRDGVVGKLASPVDSFR